MKMFILTGNIDNLKELVYYELIGRDSFKIMKQTKFFDGTDNLYIKVATSQLRYFLEVVDAYGVSIRWEEAA